MELGGLIREAFLIVISLIQITCLLPPASSEMAAWDAISVHDRETIGFSVGHRKLQDCAECNGEKDTYVTATYIDSSGIFRAKKVHSKDLSASWIWQNPDDNIQEVIKSHLNEDRLLWKLGTLPPGLITFYNLTYPLDQSWHVLGLGYDPAVEISKIEAAAVIHYNGNYKPWLDLSLGKYRKYWSKYIMFDNPYIKHCHINQLS